MTHGYRLKKNVVNIRIYIRNLILLKTNQCLNFNELYKISETD